MAFGYALTYLGVTLAIVFGYYNAHLGTFIIEVIVRVMDLFVALPPIIFRTEPYSHQDLMLSSIIWGTFIYVLRALWKRNRPKRNLQAEEE